MSKTIVAVFQTWGHDNCSALILASVRGQEDVDAFIASHYESGTYASIHTYYDEEEAYSDWVALQQ